MGEVKLKSWAGFIRGKPHASVVQDTYGVARNCIQLFDIRADGRKRFKDVRRVDVTIREVRKRSKS